MTLTGNRAAAALVLTFLVATGCGMAGASPSAPIRSLEVIQTPDLTPDQTPGGPSPAAVNLPAEVLDPILDDATDQSGVPRDQLVVTHAEPVTWPDGGLGCPEPGMVYIQVLVDGYWVVVQAGKQVLDYRAGERGGFRLCTLPPGERRPPAEPGGGAGPY